MTSYITNPKTGRPVKMNSRTYKRLLSEGVIKPVETWEKDEEWEIPLEVNDEIKTIADTIIVDEGDEESESHVEEYTPEPDNEEEDMKQINAELEKLMDENREAEDELIKKASKRPTRKAPKAPTKKTPKAPSKKSSKVEGQ